MVVKIGVLRVMERDLKARRLSRGRAGLRDIGSTERQAARRPRRKNQLTAPTRGTVDNTGTGSNFGSGGVV